MSVSQKGAGRRVLMLLSNAFDPDPRVHREAKALVTAGYQVTILGWDRDRKSAAAETVDGIQVERVYIDSSHGRGLSQILFLAVFWAKALCAGLNKSFDVVHAHDFDTLPLGFLLARLRKAKLVYDSHESYVDMVHWLPAWARECIVRVENYIMSRSELVITVGDLLRDHLESRGARNACVVGNWQDPEKFVFDEQELEHELRRLGVKEGQKVIAYIANLGRERRIPELIQAVAQAPDCFLVLGGKGPCADLAQEAASKHVNIAYLGYVDPARVPFYTALSDIVFYGFDPDNPNARFSAPNKLFECLAAGKAMITGNFGEIARIVKNVDCGVILNGYSVEEIKAALSGMPRTKLREYGVRAHQGCLQSYSWQVAQKTLISRYGELDARLG